MYQMPSRTNIMKASHWLRQLPSSYVPQAPRAYRRTTVATSSSRRSMMDISRTSSRPCKLSYIDLGNRRDPLLACCAHDAPPLPQGLSVVPFKPRTIPGWSGWRRAFHQSGLGIGMISSSSSVRPGFGFGDCDCPVTPVVGKLSI